MYGVRNSVADCALHDVLHWLYQGVLYFQNFIQFHGTCVHVISFRPITEVRLSLCWYSHNSPSRDKIVMDVSCIRLYQPWMKRVINWAKCIFLFLRKYVPSTRLHQNWMKSAINWAKFIFYTHKVRLLYQTVPKLDETCNKLGKIYFPSPNKVKLSVHLFLRKWIFLSSPKSRSTPNV